MIDLIQEENQRLKTELAALRKTIMQAEPLVMVDGRFEQMMTTPITVIDIARKLIVEKTAVKHQP